jgi:urease accessory protein
MIRLTHRLSGPAEPQGTLTLTYEQRTRSRLRVTLDDGQEAGLFLERGLSLRDGDLVGDDERRAILVRAAAEPVSTVHSDDPVLLARACWHLGNRHVLLEIRPGRLRYRHDHVLDNLVHGLGLSAVFEDAPFEPEPGAYGGSAPAHTHDHA